jgi:ABC-2 type transport system permease protein
MMTSAFLVLLRRELGSFLLSPVAYVLLVCISLVSGYNFITAVQLFESGMKNLTVVQVSFLTAVFWFFLVPMIPILTMRLFSEEYRSGTIEMLMTAPVRDFDIVASKFTAAFLIYILLWVPNVLALGVFQVITKGLIPLNPAIVGLSYLIIMLIGAFWISIGLFASSLTKNQIIAAIISLSAIFFLFFFPILLQGLSTEQHVQDVANYLGSYTHVRNFTFGAFDSRPVVFYLSGTALFLFLTTRVLAARKLKA